MKRIIKNKKKNNAGFSLLEVLLAVVLLAIVVTPLIQTIYTSMSLNKKARILMGATDLGQTTIESFESQTYPVIVAAHSGNDNFNINATSNGFNYLMEVHITPLFEGTNYSVYEVKVDVYYLKDNNPLNKEFMATYKGSVFNKIEES